MNYSGLFIGLATIDIQYFVDIYPESNKTIKTSPPDILVGGPATNAATAFAHLNNEAFLVTAIGENSFTNFFQKDFENNQVKLVDLIQSQNTNPVLASVITSKNGNRNIFTNNPADIQSIVDSVTLFEKIKPQIVMIDGFYPEFSLKCAKLAKSKNIPVVIDLGSWKPQFEELLHFVDFAICSEDFYPPNCVDNKHVFDFLTQKKINKIAISRGPKNILFKHKNEYGEIEINRFKVVDSLGAGDFLHGAFCYYFLQTNNFRTALRDASELASLTCKYKGTRTWLQFI